MKKIHFKTKHEWEKWLKSNHTQEEGIFMVVYKKATGVPTVSYEDALEVSLKYGWIDGKIKSRDSKTYLRSYTPRRAKSVWSKINKDLALQLIKEGKMLEPGMEKINEAKKNGNWQNAYESSPRRRAPKILMEALKNNSKAKNFFDTLSKAQRSYFINWIYDAKRTETKEDRVAKTILKLNQNKKFFE